MKKNLEYLNKAELSYIKELLCTSFSVLQANMSGGVVLEKDENNYSQTFLRCFYKKSFIAKYQTFTEISLKNHTFTSSFNGFRGGGGW